VVVLVAVVAERIVLEEDIAVVVVDTG